MRYLLGGIETLHHGFSGPATPPRREKLVRGWRAKALREDGTETLLRLAATHDELRRKWAEAFEDWTPDELRQVSEVWLERFRRGPRGRGTWEPVEQCHLRNLRFRISMKAKTKARKRRRAA